ncbi:hypothetical protein [Spirosoma fluminis]
MKQTHRPDFVTAAPASPSTTFRSNWLWVIGLCILSAVLSSWFIGDFRHPLSDGKDTDVYEYVGYFFGKNLSFFPVPHLNLINNQTFFPYGTNQVFLDWGFERDYWYAACYGLFNRAGPYLQFYYVFSLVVTAVGSLLLLQPRFGTAKSFLTGLIVSVFNFYATYKFPVHMNVCTAHWTTLCIIATYRLLFDVTQRQPVSLAYVLLWMWLHVQVLSQELAYVAGFALTFTTITIPVLLFSLTRSASLSWKDIQTYLKSEYRKQPYVIWGLSSLLVLSLYLYLPLTLQIAFTAWQFDFDAVPELRAWSHPLRLFIPYLPAVDTFAVPDYQRWLHDMYESYGQGSPGLYLTILAGIGLWQTRQRITLWLPIVLTLVLCLLYHPTALPTLKLFPWFSFNRHGGRASLIYPVLFCLLALPIRWSATRTGWTAACLLGLLMLSEWTHAFRLRISLPVNVASGSLMNYCATVKQQPGVAVLDWPFCTVGADGVGAQEGLCPYYEQQNSVFTYRRFHDKHVVGQYFGRLHPDQIQPFLRDGWPRLLAPGRVFTDQDWRFLNKFLAKNNFAGINLYTDLLTASQVADFHKQYGRPMAETRLPGAGRVEFISLKNGAKK